MFGVGGLLGLGGLGIYDSESTTESLAKVKKWAVLLTVGGIDTSSQLTGRITIRRKVREKTTAEFILVPSESPIDVFAYIGAQVSISIVVEDIGTFPLFNGKVEKAPFDSTQRVFSVYASDKYQKVIKALEISEIDALIPGNNPTYVSGDFKTRYDYALARLESALGDVCLDIDQAPAYLAWGSPAKTFSYGAGDIDFNKLVFEPLDQDRVINRVEIELQHRFAIAWQRYWSLLWDIGWNDTLWITQHRSNYPFKSDIEDSFPYPFQVTVWRELPPTGDYIDEPIVYHWTNRDTDKIGTLGFSASLMQRWKQTVLNKFSFIVKNDASIARFQVQRDKRNYALDTDDNTEFDEAAEDYTTPTPDAKQLDHLIANSLTYCDMLYGTKSSMTALKESILYLLQSAKKRILESHRSGGFSFSCPLNPTLALGDGVAANNGTMNAAGECDGLVHVLDIDSGEATTEVSCRCYMTGDGGQPDDAIALPGLVWDWPVEAALIPESLINPTDVVLPALETHIGYKDTPVAYSEDWRGFIGNLANTTVTIGEDVILIDNQVYPTEFVVEIPEAPAADRDERLIETSASYDVEIPAQTLELL